MCHVLLCTSCLCLLPAFYLNVFAHVPIVNKSFCPCMFPLSVVRSSTSVPQVLHLLLVFDQFPAFVPSASPVCSQVSFFILSPSLLLQLLVLASFVLWIISFYYGSPFVFFYLLLCAHLGPFLPNQTRN